MIISIILLVAFSLGLHYYQRSYHLRKYKAEKLHKNFNSAKECFIYFHVEIPEGYVIYHLNGDKKDNRFYNLFPMSRTDMLKLIGKHKNNEKK